MKNLTKLHAALKVANYFGPPNTPGMISAPAAPDPSATLGGAGVAQGVKNTGLGIARMLGTAAGTLDRGGNILKGRMPGTASPSSPLAQAIQGAKPYPYKAPAPAPAKAPDTKAINLPGEQIVSPDVLSGKLPVQMLGGDPANPSVMANVPVPGAPMDQPTTKPAPDWNALFARAHGTSFNGDSKMDSDKMKIMKQMAAEGADTSNPGAFARKLYANKGYRQKFPQYA